MDNIVGYTYRAENYTPAGMIAHLPTGEGEPFDGWALGEGINLDPNENIREIAFSFGVDLADPYSFNSDDFPKPIFADEVDVDTFIGQWDENGDFI